jgi:phage portal protein BeeE
VPQTALVERVAAALPALWSWAPPAQVAEAATARIPERAGYEYGVPPGGLQEWNQGQGAATGSDRKAMLSQLYDAYIACPWAWACVQAIARTITAGGLVTDWDRDTGEGDQAEPAKPENVKALERLLGYVNAAEDARQLMRNVITDLLVFGDAFVEVVWWASTPVALYSLDCPSMMPIADEHGTVSKYVQLTDYSQRAEFEPRDVIHISLDAPRSGIFGVSPTQAAMLPITAWLFAAATGKEMFRKGLPPSFHADFPAGTQESVLNRWLAMYASRNIGPRNIGTPVTTRGGAVLKELQQGKITDVREFLAQKRDEIIADYGVPPAVVSIIEAGNLGGGTGETQWKGFLVRTCDPIAQLVLEKLNFAITRGGFGVEGWHLKFRDVDWRDSKVIEDIRSQRLRDGTYTLNRLRAEVGEPPVDGGDVPIFVERQMVVAWKDIQKMSDALIASAGAKGAAPPPPGGQPGADPETPPPEESAVMARVVQYARYQAALAEARGKHHRPEAIEGEEAA